MIDTEPNERSTELTDIGGVDEDLADELWLSGYRTIDDLRAASEDDIAGVDGVSTPLAARIKADIGDSAGEGNGSENHTMADTPTEEFSFLGLKWYHFAIVLFFSSGTLLGTITGDVSIGTVLMALGINFAIVFALTKLYRWLQGTQAEPEPASTIEGTSAESDGATEQISSADDKTPDDGFITTTVPGASETKEQRGAIAVILFAVGMIVAVSVFGGLGVIAVLGVLGVLLFFGGLDAQRVERRELATFQSTTGTVIATEIQETVQGGRKPLIEYKYTVDGQSYKYDKIWPGKPSAQIMSPRRVQGFLSSYSEGKDITVYYDPADPSNAFLVRDSWAFWHISASLVGAGLLAYVGLVILGMIPVPTVTPA